MTPESFLLFADPLPEPMALVSGDGCVLAHNRACEERLDVSRQGWRGKALADIVVDPPDEVARYLKFCSRTRQTVLGAITVRGRGEIVCRAEGSLVRPKTQTSDAVVMMRLLPKQATTGQFITLNLRIEELGREIQRRKRAERDALENAERLRTTLASIGDGVIATDINGRITTMNAVAESLTGWTNDEATGVPLTQVFNIINEDTRQAVENPAMRALKEAVVVGLANHTILIAKDGTQRSIDDSAAPIRCKEGEVVGCVLVFRDITERRRLERQNTERLQAAQLLSAVVDSSIDAIITKSLEGTIQSWNAAAERLFGFSAAQAVGQHISLVIPPERHGEEDQIMARIRAGGRVQHMETVRVSRDGLPIHVSVSMSPVRDEVGRIVGASKIVRDITERKLAEQELRAREHRYRTLVEATSVVTWHCPSSGLYVEPQPAWMAFTGQTAQEMLGTGWTEAVHPDDVGAAASRWTEAVARSVPFLSEHRIRRHDAEWRWMRVHAAPIRYAAGQIVEWFGMCFDITERKQAEATLRGSEEFNRSLMDASTDCVKVLDLDGHLLHMNAPGRRVMEIDDFGPLCGQEWSALWPVETRQDIERSVAVARGGDSYSFQAFCPTAKGTPRWWDVMVSPIRGAAEGSVLRLLSISRDITARKETEQALREKAHFLQRVAEIMPGVLSVFDLTTRNPVFVNRTVAALIGYTYAEVQAMGTDVVARLMHPEDVPRFEQHLARVRALSDGETAEFEFRIRDRAGEWHWFDSQDAVFTRDAAGAALQLISAAMEITERKRTEAKLRDSEQRLQLALDGGEMGVWEWDPATNAAIVDARSLALFGLRESEFDGTAKAFTAVKLDEDWRTNLRKRETAIANRSLYRNEFRVRHPDGTVRWLASSAQPTLREGKVGIRLCGVHFDITERKQAEEALQERNRQAELLGRISQRLLLGAESEADLLASIFGEIAESIDMEMFYHYRPSEDARELRLHTSGGITDAERSLFATIPFGELLSGRVAERRERIIVEDLQHASHPGSDALLRVGATSYAGFPLVSNAELVGTIAFVSKRRTHLPSEVVQLLQFIFDQLALALERRRLQRVLRDSEERLRLAFDAAGMGNWDVDLRTGMAVWSERHAAVLGYRASGELHTMQQWQDRVHPDDVARVLAAAEQAKLGRTPFAVEHRVCVPGSDAIRWLSLYGRFFEDETGQPVRFSGVSQDITQRKVAEAAQRESELRFHALVERIGDVFWISDPSIKKLLYVSPAITDIWGRRPRELLENFELWFEAIHEDDRTRVAAAFFANIYAGTYDTEYRVVRPDGSIHWVRDRGKPLGIGTLVAGVAEDITERKRTEEELQRLASELSEADRHKDEFLAILAHELRNPLAPIRNGLQIMRLANVGGPAVEKARNMMERQLGQMVHLVDDLLDVSRISRGKLELRKQRIDLAAVINDAVETARPVIEATGHELMVVMPPQPIVMDADLTRLSQVFSNLLNNAAKYSRPGGQIVLTAEPHASDVVVSVKDRGFGIAADQLPRIFELFSQVDRSLDNSNGGLGIGLSLVKRLVEMHGGRIEAKSEGLGKGSEFLVWLPAVAEASVLPDADEKAETDVKSALRVLIVDDNRDSADSTEMLLKMMGNDTRTAYDGEEAVAAAIAYRPDLILLDIGLPKLDGYEVCRRIRNQVVGKKLVIVAHTGWGQDEDRQRAHDSGFDHHMVKPADPQTLMRVLRSLTEHA